MTGVAQTQRPRHVAVERQAEGRRRPMGSVVARLAAAATELERPERTGAAHRIQDSIGGRGTGRQQGLTALPALDFFDEDTGREGLSSGEGVTVGRVFLLAASLEVSRDHASMWPRSHDLGKRLVTAAYTASTP